MARSRVQAEVTALKVAADATAEKNALAILLYNRTIAELLRETKEMRRCNFVNAALATSLHTESWALKSELAALKETLRLVKAAADDTATANKQMTVHFAFMRLRE